MAIVLPIVRVKIGGQFLVNRVFIPSVIVQIYNTNCIKETSILVFTWGDISLQFPGGGKKQSGSAKSLNALYLQLTGIKLIMGSTSPPLRPLTRGGCRQRKRCGARELTFAGAWRTA